MPFPIRASSNRVSDQDKVKGCDFDISEKTEKVKEWCLRGGDLNGDDPGTLETFTKVTLNLHIVFQLEKYGRLSQDKTYTFDYSPDSSIKDFLQDLVAICRLSKNADVAISRTEITTIWLSNYRPSNIPFSVSLGFFEESGCRIPYLNVAGTGYYLEKDDLKALGEWLLSNIQ